MLTLVRTMHDIGGKLMRLATNPKTKKLAQKMADALLDVLEEAVADTNTKVDDELVAYVRKVLSVPEFDEE